MLKTAKKEANFKTNKMIIKIFIALMIFTVVDGIAQTKKDGTPDMRYKANKEVYSAPPSTLSSRSYSVPKNNYYAPSTSTTYSTERPAYSGSTHTESHGGKYEGETNPHHKDGKYINPNSNPFGRNVYGTHKTTATKRN